MAITSTNATASQIDLQRMTLVEARVANERKSVGLAYLLWFFLGGLGMHNFYLGKTMLALFQLIGMPVGATLTFLGLSSSGGASAIGLTICAFVALTLLFDLFLIPGRVRAHSERVRERLRSEFGDTSK